MTFGHYDYAAFATRRTILGDGLLDGADDFQTDAHMAMLPPEESRPLLLKNVRHEGGYALATEPA
jgi:hypothetical protein